VAYRREVQETKNGKGSDYYLTVKEANHERNGVDSERRGPIVT